MLDTLLEWGGLLLRWAHMIAGIMWVGNSFYFVWMDSSFEKLLAERKGVDGELYMVHGGNFYHVEKRRFGPGEMPKNLHWFIWEATFTWITGFLLLTVVYYLTDGAFLVDPRVSAMTPGTASLIGLATLFGSWFVYDGLFRIRHPKISTALGLGFVVGIIYFLTHTFSGRGAFIHLGAMFGTWMVLNVWVHILPNQRAIIQASLAGQNPDYDLGKKAKRRSMHNSYMTLPVLFAMISNHFPSTYSHPYSWVVLSLIVVMGASVRHYMITLKKWALIPATAILLFLMFWTAPKKAESNVNVGTVTYAQANAIISNRCLQCHSETPTDDIFKVAPNGVKFNRLDEIKQWSARILDRATVKKDMPLANKTGMTDEERVVLRTWIEAGLPTP